MNHFMMNYSNPAEILLPLEKEIKALVLSLQHEERTEASYTPETPGVSKIVINVEEQSYPSEVDNYVARLMTQFELLAFLYQELLSLSSDIFDDMDKFYIGPKPACLDQKMLEELIGKCSPDEEDKKFFAITDSRKKVAFLKGIAPLEDIETVLQGNCNSNDDYEVFSDLFTTLLYMKLSNAGYHCSVGKISQIFRGGLSDIRKRLIKKISCNYDGFYQ